MGTIVERVVESVCRKVAVIAFVFVLSRENLRSVGRTNLSKVDLAAIPEALLTVAVGRQTADCNSPCGNTFYVHVLLLLPAQEIIHGQPEVQARLI